MTGTLRKLFHEGFLITFQKQVLAYKGNYDRKETFSFIKHICLFALYPPPWFHNPVSVTLISCCGNPLLAKDSDVRV